MPPSPTAPERRLIWTNTSASSFTDTTATDGTLAHEFHTSLPDFERTPLVPLHDLAAELGVRGVFVKDESSRLGLPSFKILGASWGTCRAVAELVGLGPSFKLEEVAARARDAQVKLVAATDGNHGRAVARMAKLMGLEADIYVPAVMDQPTESLIAGEGAHVTRVDGDYDAAVARAAKEVFVETNSLLIQDTSFERYETVPRWIIQGYSTLVAEAESQLEKIGLSASILITPIGVGSLGHAAVSFAKSNSRQICVIAVEPDNAACLHNSLKTDDTSPIETSETIMAGMNCGTVSPMSWPLLSQGIDASVTVSDWEAHVAVQYLQKHGVNAGPCGAASLAALRRVAAEDPGSVGLCTDSVVVLLSTEGAREYNLPEDESNSAQSTMVDKHAATLFDQSGDTASTDNKQ